MSIRTHEYEIVCSCGNRWRLDFRHEPEHVECAACGARTAGAVDLGQMRPGEPARPAPRSASGVRMAAIPKCYFSDQVHQASGMVSAQLDCGVAEALDLLIIRGDRSNQGLERVAVDVINHVIRFEP